MRLSLQSYFDLGYSLGLGDAVFRNAAEESVPNIAKVGISNPLGQGVGVNLCEDHRHVLDLWKKEAIAKAFHPDIETGYIGAPDLSEEENESRKAQFRKDLAAHIKRHDIDRCTLTIYAVGVVFLRLDHAPGIPNEFLQGFHKCYEYAAYLVDVSDALYNVAAKKIGDISNPLKDLSRRPAPAKIKDETGFEESKQFSGGFSCVALCIDEGDRVPEVIDALRGVEGNDLNPLIFDYHGKLHFGWAVSVLEPRPKAQRTAEPIEEIDRMVENIQIAHVFLGACQAFENLFLQETRKQVDGYVKGERGRSSTELNRLRTLALAVVTLTQYAGVAEALEDQKYFDRWEENAKITKRHEKIQQQCELLYNVQAAETQSEEAKRERTLNRVVLILTAGTLISVLVDSYEFVDYKEGWFGIWLHRALLLSAVVLLVATILAFVLRTIGRTKSA